MGYSRYWRLIVDIWTTNHDLVLSIVSCLGLGFGSIVFAILYSGSD